MSCLESKEIMNYLLGREENRAVRLHLAKCKKCRDRMTLLDNEPFTESLELQDQSHSFRLNPPNSKKAVG